MHKDGQVVYTTVQESQLNMQSCNHDTKCSCAVNAYFNTKNQFQQPNSYLTNILSTSSCAIASHICHNIWLLNPTHIRHNIWLLIQRTTIKWNFEVL